MKTAKKVTDEQTIERFSAPFDLESVVQALEGQVEATEQSLTEYVSPEWKEFSTPILEKLQAAQTKLLALRPEGNRLVNLGRRVIQTGVLTRSKQIQLQENVKQLEDVLGRGVNAIVSAIEELESTYDLHPQFWPKPDRWAGCLANPGYAQELMERVSGVIASLGPVETLKPRRLVREHPLAETGAISIED